ncbi:hypothetical protein Q7P37_004758 [Cladosporium fusiforme]
MTGGQQESLGPAIAGPQGEAGGGPFTPSWVSGQQHLPAPKASLSGGRDGWVQRLFAAAWDGCRRSDMAFVIRIDAMALVVNRPAASHESCVHIYMIVASFPQTPAASWPSA